MSLWKSLRILILLLILFGVAANEYLNKQRGMDWSRSMSLVIYPQNADGDSRTQQYIDQLNADDFDDIRQFLVREAARYGQSKERYMHIALSKGLLEAPPEPPKDRSPWKVALWSLSFRWFAWWKDNHKGLAPDVQMFVRYYHPDNLQRLPHSLGMQKGRIGAVHAFSHKKQAGQNNMVIAHELLHTLGATDKYDSSNNEPIFPVGYAEPERGIQRYTEIMAGRKPMKGRSAVMPKSLSTVQMGEQTAAEVGLR